MLLLVLLTATAYKRSTHTHKTGIARQLYQNLILQYNQTSHILFKVSVTDFDCETSTKLL